MKIFGRLIIEKYILICLICCSTAFSSLVQAKKQNKRADETDTIIKKIMDGYEKGVHPNSNQKTGAVQVQIGVTPLALNIDEGTSTVTSHIWMALAWRDDRLKWERSSHMNISSVHIAPERLWKPDIRLFNSIIHEDYEDTDAIIYSWGMAFWVPPVTTHTSCELDYSYWPWDIQKCNMVIGSWTKSGWEVDVFNMGQTDGTKNVSSIYLGNYAGTLWEIVSANSHREVKFYKGIDSPWPAIRVHLVLRRISFVDRKITVLPLVLVSCLTLATFWTHPSSSHRIRLGCLNLFILIFMLAEARTRLPMAGSQLPLVVSFAGSLAVLVMIQLIAALSLNNLVSRSDTPPSFLIWPLQGTIWTNILCLTDAPLVGQIPGMTGYSIDVEALRNAQQQNSISSSEAAAGSGGGDKTSASQSSPQSSSLSGSSTGFSGWNLLCQAIDRVLFISYLAIILIFIASYLGGAAVASANAAASD